MSLQRVQRCSTSVLRCATLRSPVAHVPDNVRTLAIGGYESNEYHRHSTRYHHNPRETIASVEQRFQAVQFHHTPQHLSDKFAFRTVRFLRWVSDVYFKRRYVYRACMLETIAAVPGIVSGLSMHLSSLRRMRHNFWIKIVMDEAENERMHLMTFMQMLQPNTSQRALLFMAQGVFFFGYMVAYCVSKKTCHRFVGYLEEEAVHTYTEFLKDIDNKVIDNVQAPDIAKKYWNLPDDATLRDVVIIIRADEADHRDVNHKMSDIRSREAYEHDLSKEEAAQLAIRDILAPTPIGQQPKAEVRSPTPAVA